VSPPPLPWKARAALLVCTLLAGLVGLSASEDMVRLRRLSEVQLLLPRSPLISAEVMKQAEEVARASLFGMRGPRMVVLALLTIACTATFIAVLRVWKPLGLPRAGVLKLTSFAALACGLLRTIEGAQQAVIVRRIAFVLAAGVGQGSEAIPDPEVARAFARLLPDLEVAAHVAWTLLIAGTFVTLSQYFRSPRARELFTAGDPSP